MPSAIAHTKNGWYIGAGSYSGEATRTGVNASATAVEAGRKGGNYTAGVKVLNAEAAIGRANRSYTIGGEVTLAKYSGSYTLPWKFRGQTVTVGGEVALGTLGLRASWGGSYKGVYFGVGGWGAGISIDVRR